MVRLWILITHGHTIGFDLNVFTATAEGGLQIVEQILPFFPAELHSYNKRSAAELNIKEDVRAF